MNRIYLQRLYCYYTIILLFANLNTVILINCSTYSDGINISRTIKSYYKIKISINRLKYSKCTEYYYLKTDIHVEINPRFKINTRVIIINRHSLREIDIYIIPFLRKKFQFAIHNQLFSLHLTFLLSSFSITFSYHLIFRGSSLGNIAVTLSPKLPFCVIR